jgi:hypothetical protein
MLFKAQFSVKCGEHTTFLSPFFHKSVIASSLRPLDCSVPCRDTSCLQGLPFFSAKFRRNTTAFSLVIEQVTVHFCSRRSSFPLKIGHHLFNISALFDIGKRFCHSFHGISWILSLFYIEKKILLAQFFTFQVS